MVQYSYFFGILMRNRPNTITARPAIFVGVTSSPKNRAEPKNTRVFTMPTERGIAKVSWVRLTITSHSRKLHR